MKREQIDEAIGVVSWRDPANKATVIEAGVKFAVRVSVPDMVLAEAVEDPNAVLAEAARAAVDDLRRTVMDADGRHDLIDRVRAALSNPDPSAVVHEVVAYYDEAV